MTPITDPLAIYETFREDQRAEDNARPRYTVTHEAPQVYRVTDTTSGRYTDCESMIEANLLVQWAEDLNLPEGKG